MMEQTITELIQKLSKKMNRRMNEREIVVSRNRDDGLEGDPDYTLPVLKPAFDRRNELRMEAHNVDLH
jgi:hypothetical protein